MRDDRAAMVMDAAVLRDPVADGSTSTSAEDYGDYYYRHYSSNPYEVGHAAWEGFFASVADRIMAVFAPATMLDAGCARGFLVAQLAERGVDARGVDISDYAVTHCDPRAAGRLRVGSLTEDLGGPYDLVTLIEVIEHMNQADGEKALDRVCAATDVVIFSSTPSDLRDVTHVNVRLPQHWAGMFAERGFFRRHDVDLAFLSPWAVCYVRANPTPRDLARSYEEHLAMLQVEVAEKRIAGLALTKAAAASEARADAAVAERDRVVGERDAELGAARARLAAEQARVARIRARLKDAESRLAGLTASRRWRVASAVSRPAEVLRRRLR